LGGIVAELKTLNTTTMEMNLQLVSHGMKLDRSTSILGDIRSEIARQTDKLAKAIQESGGNVGVSGGSSSGSSGGGLGGTLGKLAEGAALAGALKGGGKLTEDALKSLAEKGYKPRGTGFVNKAGKFVSAAEIDGALGGQATTVLSKAPGIMSKLGGVGRLVGRFGGPLAGLVSGAEAYHESGSLAQAGGAAAGGWGGMEAGAALGAAGGTMILPGVGTAIGGVVGGLAGSGVGAWAGKKLGSMLDRPAADAAGNMSVGTLNVTAGTVNVGAGPVATQSPVAPSYPASPATPARVANPVSKSPVTKGGLDIAGLIAAGKKYGIEGVEHMSSYLAEVATEVGSGKVLTENLNYSAEGLKKNFGKRFSDADAAKYAHNPEAIANKAYGGRMGNTEPGDGWKYRGRGFIQLTGKANYAEFTKDTKIDILSNPDLAARPDVALEVAAWYYAKKIDKKFDPNNTAAIRKAVNGGTNGLATAEKWKTYFMQQGELGAYGPQLQTMPSQSGAALKAAGAPSHNIVVAAPITNNNQTTNNVAVSKGSGAPRTPAIPAVDPDSNTLKSVFY
jgi:putative chitinase